MLINNILSSVANDIQCIDFSKSEDYVMDKLYKFSDIDIKNNIKWLIKHSVKYNYLELTENFITFVNNINIVKNINLEYYVTTYDMLKILDRENILDISYMNYILVERFINDNNLKAIKYILNKYNIDKEVIEQLNIDFSKIDKKLIKLLKEYNVI